MQTFNADIRKEMQRLDSPEYIIRRLEEISAIDNLAVVIDLLFGFPGQKGKVWTDDLKIVSELPIDGVDCYQLNVFEKSPLSTPSSNPVFVIRQRRLLKPPTCMLKALSIFLLIPIGIV